MGKRAIIEQRRKAVRLLETTEWTELYDFMARIVRFFLDEEVNVEELCAADGGEIPLQDWISEENVLSLRDIDISAKTYLQLADALQVADEVACGKREGFLWKEKMDWAEVRDIDSLNSESSSRETNILLLPRYKCMWEGASRDKNHRMDVNSLLENSFFVEMKDGKVEGKYTIRNHILNPALFGICMREEVVPYLPIAVSPLTGKIKRDKKKWPKYVIRENGINVNYFGIKDLYEPGQEAQVEQYIERAVCVADKAGNKILVFPEMFGTAKMKEQVIEFLKGKMLKSLYFIVFPSIWEQGEDNKNHNTAYVIDSNGKEWFGQEKLKRYPMKDKDEKKIFLEDIAEGREIHLIYGENYGCIGIAICRSELDRETRDILLQKLNVKLVLCPSWSTGHYEFERSILAGIEMTCNVVWCNTCSALENAGTKGSEKEANKEQVVAIITTFGKNRTLSTMSLDDCRYTVSSECRTDCKGGCVFSGRIYGIEYNKEGKCDDGESSENIIGEEVSANIE